MSEPPFDEDADPDATVDADLDTAEVASGDGATTGPEDEGVDDDE